MINDIYHLSVLRCAQYSVHAYVCGVMPALVKNIPSHPFIGVYHHEASGSSVRSEVVYVGFTIGSQRAHQNSRGQTNASRRSDCRLVVPRAP